MSLTSPSSRELMLWRGNVPWCEAAPSLLMYLPKALVDIAD